MSPGASFPGRDYRLKHRRAFCESAFWLLAFEMTHILESEGEAVDLLAIIDTWVVENTQNRSLWKIYYYYDKIRRLSNQPWSSRMPAVQQAVGNRLKWWAGAKSTPRKSGWIQTYWPGEDFVPAQPFYHRPDPLLGLVQGPPQALPQNGFPTEKRLLLLRELYVRDLAAALSKT